MIPPSISEILGRLKRIDPSSLGRRMLTGAVVGLVFISLIVFRVDSPDPAWGPYWRIRPLVLTPLIAALGMLAFFARDILLPESPVKKFLVFLLSVAAFLISLWLGTILGLDGTLWN